MPKFKIPVQYKHNNDKEIKKEKLRSRLLKYLIAYIVLTAISGILTAVFTRQARFGFQVIFMILAPFLLPACPILWIYDAKKIYLSIKYFLIIVISIAFTVGYVMFSVYLTLPMCVDIPAWIFHKYTIIEGHPNNVHETTGKGSTQYFDMNEVNFSISRNSYKLLNPEFEYKIRYLSSSKYIIDIEQIYSK